MNIEIDDLSEEIDRINSGQAPTTKDRETSELLEVSLLLRRSGLSVRPPEHILSATVQSACEGLKNQKENRRRNSWMYSGMLGAAAAMLIFFGIHGFRSVHEVAPLATPAPQHEPATYRKKALQESTPSTQYGHQPEMKNSSPEPDQADPKLLSPSAPQSSSITAASAQPQSPAVSQTPSPARVPVPSQKKALSEKSSAPPAAGQTSRDTIIALRLSGRIPDSVIKDSAAGSIRQTYDSGTPHELIVTQRIMAQSEIGAGSQSRQYVSREPDKGKNDGPNKLNKVVLYLHGQEVTLEGRQTLQELTDLANSLYL